MGKNCYSLKLPNSEEIQSQEKLIIIVDDEKKTMIAVGIYRYLILMV